MTTPERIWLDKAFQPWRVWTVEMSFLPEYVRRDPAVLAELPEVQALADDLASCIAMIQHAIGQGKDTFIEPDTKRKLSDARTRLETFRAAAIREGRG
jgi:hypothetical protein